MAHDGGGDGKVLWLYALQEQVGVKCVAGRYSQTARESWASRVLVVKGEVAR